jgi:hypothetical protein
VDHHDAEFVAEEFWRVMAAMPHIRVVHVIYSFGIGGLEKGITTLINHGSDDIAHIIISLCGTKDSEKLLKKPAQIICLDKQGGNSPRFIWDVAVDAPEKGPARYLPDPAVPDCAEYKP